MMDPEDADNDNDNDNDNDIDNTARHDVIAKDGTTTATDESLTAAPSASTSSATAGFPPPEQQQQVEQQQQEHSPSSPPAPRKDEAAKENPPNSNNSNSTSVTAVSVRDALGREGVYTGPVDIHTGLPHGDEGSMLYPPPLSAVSTAASDSRNNNNNSIYSPNRDWTTIKYCGSWKQGHWQGRGQEWMHASSTSANNAGGAVNTYRGEFLASQKHGHGTLEVAGPVAATYQGPWQYNCQHGAVGTWTWRDSGATYTGGYCRNQRQGAGTYHDPANGISYQGEWKQGLYHGQGTYTVTDPRTGRIVKSYQGWFVQGQTAKSEEDMAAAPSSPTTGGTWASNPPMLLLSNLLSSPIKSVQKSLGSSTSDHKSSSPSLSAGTSSASGAAKNNPNNSSSQQHSLITVVSSQPWYDPSVGAKCIYRGLWHTVQQCPHGNGTAQYDVEDDEFPPGMDEPDVRFPGPNTFYPKTTSATTTTNNSVKLSKQDQHYQQDHRIVLYEGCWHDGRFHGHGRCEWQPSGDTYVGAWSAGHRHGSGTYTWGSRSPSSTTSSNNHNYTSVTMTATTTMTIRRSYTGEFVQNVRHGTGTYMYADPASRQSFYYQGEYCQGQRHGHGTLVFVDVGSTYTGRWQAGQYHGPGTLVLTDGSVYKGEFARGLYHGKGSLTGRLNNVVHDGYWNRGLPVQTAEEVQVVQDDPVKNMVSKLEKKSTTTGPSKGIPPAAPALSPLQPPKEELDEHAQGQEIAQQIDEPPAPPFVLPASHSLSSSSATEAFQHLAKKSAASAMQATHKTNTDGDYDHNNVKAVVDQVLTDAQGNPGKYTGLVYQPTGKPHGVGRLVYLDGKRIHEGFWKHGSKEGAGRCLFFPEGDFFDGEFRNNVRHGHGKYQWNNGRVYEGDYCDDLRHGHGVFRYPNGEKYQGEFVQGKRSGFGRFDFFEQPSGKHGYYEGSWKNGQYHGSGKLYFSSSDSCYEGEFFDGIMNGRGTKKKGGSIIQEGLWIRGKFQPTHDDTAVSVATVTDEAVEETMHVPTPESTDESEDMLGRVMSNIHLNESEDESGPPTLERAIPSCGDETTGIHDDQSNDPDSVYVEQFMHRST